MVGRRIAQYVCLFAIAGCSPMDMAMMTGDFDSSLQLMSGAGSVHQTPDGQRAFTFVIPENAFDGISPKEDHETAREGQLMRWIGNERVCDAGYEISSRAVANGFVHYEGQCT